MKTKPRILHLGKYDYNSREAGGVEYVIKNCTEHLKNDFDQTAALFSNSTDKIITVSDNGIKKVLFPVHIVAGYAPVNFSMPFYLKKLINSFSPEIIHVHMPGLMPFFCLPELKKRRTVVHWHADVEGTRVSKNIMFPAYRLLEKRLLQNADSIIVTSPQYLDSSRSLKKWKKKCSVIPLGITTKVNKSITGKTNIGTPDIGNSNGGINKKNIAEPENEKGLSQNIADFIKKRKFILSVGRLSYYKGYKFLVLSMKQIKDNNTVLVIAGAGTERDSLLKKIKKNNLEKKVLLPGKISEHDKNILLSRAEIFCLPSIDRAEAFGLSLVEAMQFSIPLVTTKVKGSGMNHVNLDNKTGLKVAPANSRELAKALDLLLNNKKLSKKLGKNGNQRFMENFQSKIAAENIKSHYLRILKNH